LGNFFEGEIMEKRFVGQVTKVKGEKEAYDVIRECCN
jgi:hypothetical protein